MSMVDWAKKEIEIACKHENPEWDGKKFDYGCACYQSALKAYECLMSDGHSGTSFGYTKNILIRLMEGLPLKPIDDKDFFIVNNKKDYEFPLAESEESLKKRGLKSSIQCPRMYSLFRYETLDGKVIYSDIDRCYGIDINNSSYTYCGGGICDIIDEMFPIKMPYYPVSRKYKVYTEYFLTNERNGDYDTKAYLFCITPDGEKVEINKFFTEKDNKWVEINKDEYDKLKLSKIK